MFWAPMLAMSGLGLLSGMNQQKQQKKYNQAAAEYNRYSPWTGRTMQQRFDAQDPMSGALQGGVSGLMLGQNLKNAQLQNDLMAKQINTMNGASMGARDGGMWTMDMLRRTT